MNKSTALNTSEFVKRTLAVFAVIFFSISIRAYSWYGNPWNGGCGYGFNGSTYYGGWCGTGIPNGLGWTLFGLEAASAIALPTAIVDSELSSSPCYNFDGNFDYDYAGYSDPYLSYGDESPYVLSTPWPLCIGVGYTIYPFSGWGYGWGGGTGYCYNGWHGCRGYDYGSSCEYYSTRRGAVGGVAYANGNTYYRGAAAAGNVSFHSQSSLAEAEQNYHVRSGSFAIQAGTPGNRQAFAMTSKGNNYNAGAPSGVRAHGVTASAASDGFHSQSLLAEAEQNYHVRSGSFATQAGTPGNRQALAMNSKGNNYNAGVPSGVRAHGVTASAASHGFHSLSTLAEAQQNYQPPQVSSQSENISKSHWNASRIASPIITDSKTKISSARSEYVTEAHPGFHGIDPTGYVQSAASFRRAANEVASSLGGGLSTHQMGPSSQSFSASSPQGFRSPSTIRQERATSSGLSSRQQVASAGRESAPATNHVSSRGASTSINREAGSSKESAGVVAPTTSHRVAGPGVAQRSTQLQHSSTGSGTSGSHSLEHGGGITGAVH